MKRYIIAIIFTLSFANPNAATAEVPPPEVILDPIIPLQYRAPIKPLEQREFKAFAPLELKPKPSPPPAPVKSPVKKPRKAYGGPNTYARGNCTWYAKSRRMDLPSNLGNANLWFARARAQGIPTGTVPQAGAIGMTKAYMHVVYIERVNANGTVFLSEMNYKGFNKVSTRTAPASEFLYIY